MFATEAPGDYQDLTGDVFKAHSGGSMKTGTKQKIT